MVKIYKKGKLDFEAPFYEFDCCITSYNDQQGSIFYDMYLIHRYSGDKRVANIGHWLGREAVKDEHRRLWNMLQQYMDVSRPLPDILPLEAQRADDPVTAAYDKETGRDSHYWRNMDDETYEKVIAERYEQEKSRSVFGPDIMPWIDESEQQGFVA